MTRTMFDAVDVARIPAGATMVAGYVDGRYQTVAALKVRFPKARLVTITVTGKTVNAHVADVETGDLTPTAGAAWAGRRLAAGYHPTLYCNTSTWPAVKAAVHAAGLDGKVSYWIAHYDGDPTLPTGAVAKQYLGDYQGYDKSCVVDYWPGVDPPLLSVPWWWHRPLHVGDTGLDVLACKRRLHRLGYRGLTFTPRFGDGLLAAVQMFQRQHRLKASGVVNRVTAHAIRTAR